MTIGFETVSYTVSEDQGCLEVCLAATGASLARSVAVMLSTESGSAIGELVGFIHSLDKQLFNHSI